jgi:hypothetical protein
VAFSYTLFLALILLFPGLCAWAALRSVERTDLMTPRPDKPNSTATLFVVVLGTLAGHVFGSLFFVLQTAWCAATSLCFQVSFDPNVYRVIFTVGRPSGRATDLAIFTWLVDLAFTGLAAGVFMTWLAKSPWVRNRWDAVDFGWLNAPVQAVKQGRTVVLAYVVTKTTHDGSSLAYQGIVQQLAVDDDQTISMLVLGQVDRFLVRITNSGVERLDDAQPSIAQMQFHLSEIANLALEVIDVGDEA